MTSTVRRFARLARSQANDGTPRAVVTVLRDLSMALHADRVLVLLAGRVVADGSPDRTARHRASERVFDHAVRVATGPRRPQAALAIESEQAEINPTPHDT